MNQIHEFGYDIIAIIAPKFDLCSIINQLIRLFKRYATENGNDR